MPAQTSPLCASNSFLNEHDAATNGPKAAADGIYSNNYDDKKNGTDEPIARAAGSRLPLVFVIVLLAIFAICVRLVVEYIGDPLT